MSRSNVHLLDLPDEILLMILKKLNNVDVLYSLLGINNRRLNILAQASTFTNILKIPDTYDCCFGNRFCNDILPRIHRNVKCFSFDPFFMKRFLLATDYPNLSELKLTYFNQGPALDFLTNEPSLRFIFQEQITHLTFINYDKDATLRSLEDYTPNVYSHILNFFKNLKELCVVGPYAVSMYQGLSLRYYPSTIFSSASLTHLYINVKTFDDCICLLDGRLRKLTTVCVNVYCIDDSLRIVHKMDKLINLKCFSLKSFSRFTQYDKIVSLVRRMSDLEKLSLYLPIRGRNTVIDGTYVQHNILNYMPQLHSFIFYICTYVDTVDLSYKLSSEDIQQTLTNIGQQHATSMINYTQYSIAACSIFSLPFQFDYLQHIGNKLPDIVFDYVTVLHVEDANPFEHEFFIRIARLFPLLKYLRISNKEPQVLNGVTTFPSDNCQLQSVIKYFHLTRLDVGYAHRDYVEQFLNETKAFIPCLVELEISAHDLIAVTKNFTRTETRRNCAKVKQIDTIGLFLYPPDVFRYFSSLYR